MKGVLIHYSTEKIVPIIKNVVFFQFSPDSVRREIIIPPKNLKAETGQASTEPVEKMTFTAQFDSAGHLNAGDALAVTLGIGPQLAALEKLVYPLTKDTSGIGYVLDKVAELIPDKKCDSTSPIPRQKYPQILLVWGLTKILPVIISSLTITELRYDKMLNPIRGEVSISLDVLPINSCMDEVAKGALKVTNNSKDLAAILSFSNVPGELKELSKEISDIVGF